MVAVKGKSSLITNLIAQDAKTSKNSSGGRTFKVYSETSKVKNLSAKESKNSLPPNASRKAVGAPEMKPKIGTMVSLDKTKSKQGTSVNLCSTRKALADISNTKSKVVETKLRNTTKTVSSIGPTIKTGGCLSRKPSTDDTRRFQAQTRNRSYSLGNADNKVIKANSVDQRSKAPLGALGPTANRTSRRNPIPRTRSSLPLLKPVNKVVASDTKQESAESSEEGRPKFAFPVKAKVGRYAVPQATNSRSSFPRHRVSDVFLSMDSRGQANLGTGLSSGKLNKPRTSIIPSQPRTRIIPSVAKTQRKLKSSASNKVTLRSRISSNGTENANHNSNVSANQSAEIQTTSGRESMFDTSLETNSRTKSIRRKSFTSSLIEKPKLFREVTKKDPLPNIYDDRNHLEVAEYVDDLYHYYWVMEAHGQPLKSYMQNQTEISPQMRAILVNWLIEVHLKFDLMQETLFLMVTLLDQYLSIARVTKNELQLVALTALLLASKYEDFWHPRVMDLIGISAQSYTRQQILQMERDFLKKLKFRLNMPTPYVFMLRFLKAAQSNEKFEQLAFYLIELCLVQYEAVNYKPSLLCASAIYLARNTLQLIPAWTPLLMEHAHYQVSEIRECAEMMLKVHQAARTSQLKVTYEKYMRSDHGRVAAIKPLDALPVC